MKMLYDIAVVESNLKNSASKTGISRVAESFAYHLLGRANCHLEVCFSVSLYEDAGLRQAMAERSLLRAQGFSWRRCAEDTVSAYKAALGQAKDTTFSQ